MRKIPRGLPYKRDRAQLVAPNLLGYPVLDGTFSIRFRVSREKYDWIKRVILELVSLSGEKKFQSLPQNLGTSHAGVLLKRFRPASPSFLYGSPPPGLEHETGRIIIVRLLFILGRVALGTKMSMSTFQLLIESDKTQHICSV